MNDSEQRLMPPLTPEAELAILARALFRTGWDDFDVGHITYRQPDDSLLILPFELGWDEVCASDIVTIDLDGRKLAGRWSAMPAILLHTEFHRARPGLAVTIHQHPRFATVWAASGRIPPAYDQRAGHLRDDEIVLYDDYRGTVSGVEAARGAVAGMGDATCALLRNHGAFVVGDSIPQAFARATSLEWRCQQAWYAEAIHATNAVPAAGHASLAGAIDSLGGVPPMLWEWAVRREIRFDPGVVE